MTLEKLEICFNRLLISPSKLKVFSKVIVGKDLVSAYMYLLKNCHYKGIKLLLKCFKNILSLLCLDKNKKLDSYFIEEILVNKDLVLKRLQPRAKGRSFKIERKYSFIKFKLKKSLTSRKFAYSALEKFEKIFSTFSKIRKI